MRQSIEANHSVQVLFEQLLGEFRRIIQSEIAILRQDIEKLVGVKPIPKKSARFYSVKEVAVELNLSEVTVHRLIKRGLLRPNRATRHIRIPREQIEEFARTTL